MYCYRSAINHRGRCANCAHEGILPGLDDSRPTCRRCSGISINVDCLRCGVEDTLYRAGTCVRCALRDDLRGLLAGDDGQVNPVFDPFIELITAMPRPASGMAWIRVNRLNHGGTVPDLLQQLGTGQLALTHDAFDELPVNGRTVNHLRGLLIKAGLLPPRDELLARYSTWLDRKLATIPDSHHRRIIEQYGRWDHLRRLRSHAQRSPVTQGQLLTAKQYTTVATEFLAWLGTRERLLADCTQADLDLVGIACEQYAAPGTCGAEFREAVSKDYLTAISSTDPTATVGTAEPGSGALPLVAWRPGLEG